MNKIGISCYICDGSGTQIYNLEHSSFCKEFNHCPGFPYCPEIVPRPCPYCKQKGKVYFDYSHVIVKATYEFNGDRYVSKYIKTEKLLPKIKKTLDEFRPDKASKTRCKITLSRANTASRLFIWHTRESVVQALKDIDWVLNECDVKEFEFKEKQTRALLGVFDGNTTYAR